MVRRESRPSTISHITLGTKQTGAPSAGNLHAGCDVAGAGNGFTVWLLRHSQRKRGATARLDLRNTAPVLDPTGQHPATALAPPLGRKTPNPSSLTPGHKNGTPTTRQTGLLPCSRQSAQNPTGTSPIAVYGPRPPDFECPLQELRATQKQDGQSQPKFGLRLCHSVACS
jgi:hypothetical protein